MLSVRSFHKSYQEEKILSIASLTLPVGVHFIRGDNGSGKTSFFKCIAGISPFLGEISVNGISLTKNPIHYRQHVNFAEAEPLYPPYLTARDLMMFVAKAKKATPQQVNYYKESLGLGWFFEKSCATYSSGMLKKLSLALAFLGTPHMIVLDEPLITLDENTRKNLFNVIQEKKETLFMLSSHQTLEHTFPLISSSYKIEKRNLVAEPLN